MQKTLLERIERVADDVVSLVLRGDEGQLAPWEPGAHIDLALPNWLTRQYSLCGDPGDLAAHRIAVRLDPLSRGGSEYVHLHLRPGRTLEVSLPRNHFPLRPAAGYLFLAGGIGITPIVPMMRAAVASGADVSLVYAGRSASSMPFAADLAAAYGDRVRLFDRGRPDLATLTAGPGTEVYCCGPASMLDAAEAVFPRVHVERFQPVRRTFGPDTAFEAGCARSGVTVPVPADESLLDALNHAGRRVPSACREGVCGSCQVSVLDGEPEHRDDIGAPAGRMYPCVSRSRSPRLVLDL
ncbi:PDR/VanB family oxidoreductase [Amycolatopsis australiensis]|uniref:Ferredoxin-NADP reductase n=1 Tax=Amycolatopsis australiensis TaxID=546364 RepID=A0A1K1STX0_9PSEU|nr:PDR/VanB family oxidoreductase [Amycolatopsis australiensis]SFW87754.1 Ferredoxin-NADP reductase [Amycolatopsis australiensis]